MKINKNRYGTLVLGSWFLLVLLGQSLLSEEILWRPALGEGGGSEVQITEESGEGPESTVVKIHNPLSQAVTVSLGAVDQPAVQGPYYQVAGRVKYENVEDHGYLEMWNVFRADGPEASAQRYFSRTLSASGPTGYVSGTSEWRDFLLPFNAAEATSPLVRLEFNLHLPGKGTVWLTPGNLEGGEMPQSIGTVTGAWWSGRTGGIIGGVFGALFGLIGTVVGALAGKGKAKGFVMGLSYGAIALGVIALIVGGIAVLLNQPRDVWHVLLLLGGIVSIVFPMNLRRIKQAYEQIELKRMESLDSLG